jgi:nicotinamidase-related amidase
VKPIVKTEIAIAATPTEFILGESPPCLVIIDMQRDFIEPGGFGATLGNDVSLLKPTIPVIAELLKTFRKYHLPIVYTREAHLPDLSDCHPAKLLRGKPSLRIGDQGAMGKILIAGEPGNSIIDELAPLPGEINITKTGKGAFYNTQLDVLLKERNVSELIFTGVTTEVCVQTSMREANDRGYNCLVVEDGTESYFPQFKRAAIDMMIAQGGIVGWSAMSQQVIEGVNKRYG